jgi:hypothetical protein
LLPSLDLVRVRARRRKRLTFVKTAGTRYENAVVVKDGKAPDEQPGSAPSGSDETPISTSGIVAKTGAAASEAAALRRRSRRRDSDPPSYRYLTPYQARLDVEMDDTAVSKVRDPSVSISLDAERSPLVLRSLFRGNRREALLSMGVGIAFGTLLVAVIAAVIRACS